MKSQKTKSCSKCQTVKSLDEFYKDKSRRDGLTVWCRSCCKISYYSNHENNKKYKNQYYAANRKTMLAYFKSKYVKRVNGSPGTIRYEAKLAGFRSGFERTIATNLKSRKIDFEYEPIKIPYSLYLEYIPDIYLPEQDIYIEIKGILDYEDRRKHLAIKRQHPDKDVRFVFMMADKKIPRLKSTHAQWASKNGFLWADGSIPEEWLNE